jgi:hypothetical protein
MTPFQTSLIAAAAALAVTACASAPSTPKTSVPSPSAAVGDAPAAATGGSAYGAANTGGGGAQQAAAPSTEGVVVMGPDGTVWIRSGASDARYRADVDSCYAYAQAQVAHDVRIESDVSAAFQSETGGLGLAELRGRMNNFERTRRVPSLFNSCMVAKGYSRQ